MSNPFPQAVEAVKAYLEQRKEEFVQRAAGLMAQYEVYADSTMIITNREDWIKEAADLLVQVQLISDTLETLE
jgi:hypothetical protein